MIKPETKRGLRLNWVLVAYLILAVTVILFFEIYQVVNK